MAKSQDSLYFVYFKAFYTDGRSVDLAIDLADRYYHLQIIGQDDRVEENGDFMPLRRRKIDQLRKDLESLDIFSWESRSFGQPGYFDAPFTYSCDFDPELEEGMEEAVLRKDIPKESLPKLHKALENAIGTTFGSYKGYAV